MRSTGSVEYHYTIALYLPNGRIVGGEGRITENATITRQELYRRIQRRALKDANVPEKDVVPLEYSVAENEPQKL